MALVINTQQYSTLAATRTTTEIPNSPRILCTDGGYIVFYRQYRVDRDTSITNHFARCNQD